MSYRVQLPVFSGPMDLLLHLVKQSEVDIHEVSIAKVLDDYLKHLEVLQQLDLHDIGDFMVMASTLMEIKSRELLPNESVEIEEELDPRDDLIRRLLEYKRYRDLARELDSRAGVRARQSNLVLPQPPELKASQDEDLLDLGELGVWDLTSAFAKLLEEIGQQGSMEIEVEKRDVGYYTHKILGIFKQRQEVRFSEVFEPSEGRYGMIGTLIALLEMMKQGYLRAHPGELLRRHQPRLQGRRRRHRRPDPRRHHGRRSSASSEEQRQHRRSRSRSSRLDGAAPESMGDPNGPSGRRRRRRRRS